MRIPKSFPSSCPLPIASWLVSPSPKFKIFEKIPTHVSSKSRTLMKECFPSGSQNTNHNPRDAKNSNLLMSPSCTLCYLSLDLSISQGVLKFHIWHPSKKHKTKILVVVKKNTKLMAMKSRCHWKIKIQLTMDQTNVEWLDKK
jgi:hypothetical protein